MGGDSSSIPADLTNVTSIVGNQHAYALLKNDGTVLAWPPISWNTGGRTSQVQEDLTNVISIKETNGAFAALKMDGTVICWGNKSNGGNSKINFHTLPLGDGVPDVDLTNISSI